jgi:hypothetical protein
MSIRKLQCTLNEKESDLPRVKQVKNGLNKAVENRFGFGFEKKNLALLAAAVDPRYGDLSFVSVESDSHRRIFMKIRIESW